MLKRICAITFIATLQASGATDFHPVPSLFGETVDLGFTDAPAFVPFMLGVFFLYVMRKNLVLSRLSVSFQDRGSFQSTLKVALDKIGFVPSVESGDQLIFRPKSRLGKSEITATIVNPYSAAIVGPPVAITPLKFTFPDAGLEPNAGKPPLNHIVWQAGALFVYWILVVLLFEFVFQFLMRI
jgi:hypothetical protein